MARVTRTVVKRHGGAVSLLTVFALIAGCGSDSETTESNNQGDTEASGPLVIGGWGGRFTEATQEYLTGPFSEETGIEAEFVDAPGEQVARLSAMVQSDRVEWDAVDSLDPSAAFVAFHEGLAAEMPDEVRAELEEYVPADRITEYGMTFSSNAFVLGCNEDVAEACPSTPEEFFDLNRFPGDRAMIDRPFIALTYALAADGVAPEDMFPMDLDRAFNKLGEIKDAVKVWYSAGDQMEQIVRDEQVSMGLLWSGRAYNVLDQGTNLAISWEGAVHEPGQWFVVADSENQEAAWDLITHIASNPEGQGTWSSEMSYGIANLDAFDLMGEEEASRLPDWPENYEKSIVPDFDWYAENRDEIESRWVEFISG
jgi:putative spermidine/putrescine transport system substrate-binding protein